MKLGDKHNKLTAIRFIRRGKDSHQYWLFKCDCGNEKVIRKYGVVSGHAKSCGCLQKETASKLRKTHGMTNTKIYYIWWAMYERCYRKKNNNYKHYGARGIKVCKKWYKFENFYEDMGDIPKGKTLDRIDNNSNYCPNNCRWATRKEQQNNTSRNHFITYKGETKTMAQWADKFGIQYNIFRSRIYIGWDIARALNN